MVATGEVQVGLLSCNKNWEWGKGKEETKLNTLIQNVKNIYASDSEDSMKQKQLMLHVSRSKNPQMLTRLSPLKDVALIASLSSMVQTLGTPLKLLKQNTERLDRVYAAQTEDYASDMSPNPKKPKIVGEE